MENILKKQKNIRFFGSGTSQKNGEEDRAMNTVVTMVRTHIDA